MADLIGSGQVIRNGISIRDTRAGRRLVTVHIRGRVECVNNVLIFVDKWLEARRGHQNQHEVRGYRYSYHAWLRNTERTILRYDSAHGEELHRHVLRPDGNEVREPITIDRLPTLTDFIEESIALAATL